MAKAAVATAFAFDHTPSPDLYRRAETILTQGSVVSDATPRFVLPSGAPIGHAWVLKLPLLYDLEVGEQGVFASALGRVIHGYGDDTDGAIESLLDVMVDTLESLEATPKEELDHSAIHLRDLLGGQMRRINTVI